MIGPNGDDEPTLSRTVVSECRPTGRRRRSAERRTYYGVTPPALRKISPICSIAFHDLASARRSGPAGARWRAADGGDGRPARQAACSSVEARPPQPDRGEVAFDNSLTACRVRSTFVLGDRDRGARLSDPPSIQKAAAAALSRCARPSRASEVRARATGGRGRFRRAACRWPRSLGARTRIAGSAQLLFP